ncbi:MAG: nicotinate-nucleotide adenylyltransferase [Bacteroidales bacterium]
MRLGILGGTFDPIHEGHLAVADAACAMLDLARVLVVPSHHPPHRPTEPRVGPYHRFAMAALAVLTRLPGRPYLASDIELAAPERSYTANTLRRLHRDGWSASQLFFITGADAFAEIATWKDYPALFELAHFAVVSRPGHPAHAVPDVLPTLRERMIMGRVEGAQKDLVMRRVVDLSAIGPDFASPAIWLLDWPTPDISSTQIRRRLRDHESITGMVPELVEFYIRRNGLYGATADDPGGKALA